jgi:hypothetical protein
MFKSIAKYISKTSKMKMNFVKIEGISKPFPDKFYD